VAELIDIFRAYANVQLENVGRGCIGGGGHEFIMRGRLRQPIRVLRDDQNACWL
jgi:hypothetical protein